MKLKTILLFTAIILLVSNVSASSNQYKYINSNVLITNHCYVKNLHVNNIVLQDGAWIQPPEFLDIETATEIFNDDTATLDLSHIYKLIIESAYVDTIVINSKKMLLYEDIYELGYDETNEDIIDDEIKNKEIFGSSSSNSDSSIYLIGFRHGVEFARIDLGMTEYMLMDLGEKANNQIFMLGFKDGYIKTVAYHLDIQQI